MWPRGVLVVSELELDTETVRTALEEGSDDITLMHAEDVGGAVGLRPDLVVMLSATTPADVRTLTTTAPRARIVVISDEKTQVAIRRLLDAGADAIVARSGWPRSLGAICRAVMTGHVCVPAASRASLEPPALSLRERQVLALMAAGLSNAEIAEQLFLAESTVKSHAASAFRRLGVNSRREAVALVLGSSDALRRIVMTSQPGERARLYSRHGDRS